MPTSRCSAEQDATRLFIDALRACLGLAPLYAPETPSVYGEERHVYFSGMPHEGKQSASSPRHEARAVAVEEKRRAEVAAVPERKPGSVKQMRLRNRKRWRTGIHP